MFRPPAILAAAALAAAVAGPAAAHHGWGSYDAATVLTVKAPLTDVTWGNPHGAAKVVWQGRTWDVVLAPTTRMETRGLTREMLAPGKAVTLVGYPRRDGTAEMRIETVTVDGKTVPLR